MQEKRYIVTLNVRVYAENDYMARKRAHQLKEKVNKHWDTGDAIIEEVGEQPFGQLHYRKLDDISKPIDKKELEELPF